MAKHAPGKRYQANKNEDKKIRKTKKGKTNILLIIFIILFIYSSFVLARWLWSNISAKQVSEKLKDEVVIVTSIDNYDKPVEEKENNIFNKINFDKLKEINKDVVGYIEIPNTNISYPILHASDNEYYLKRDIYQNYNACGSVFMDYTNTSNFTDINTVLFGHNLISGMMFANLNKIVEGELGNDIYINVYTETKNIRYKVFSTYKSEPIKAPINTNIVNEQEFIATAIQKSNIDFNVLPNEKDKIITLSTCDSSGKKRTIVHGVKILEEVIQEN